MEGGSGPGSCREPRSACGSHVPIDMFWWILWSSTQGARIVFLYFVYYFLFTIWTLIYSFIYFLFGWMIDSLSQKHQKFRDFRPKFAELSAILLGFREFSRSWERAVGPAAGFIENHWILLIFHWNLLNFIEIYWFFNEIYWNLLEFNRFYWKSKEIHCNPYWFTKHFLLKTIKKQRSRAGDPGDPPLFANFRELEPPPKRIFLSKGELRGRIEANSCCFGIVW